MKNESKGIVWTYLKCLLFHRKHRKHVACYWSRDRSSTKLARSNIFHHEIVCMKCGNDGKSMTMKYDFMEIKDVIKDECNFVGIKDASGKFHKNVEDISNI